MQRHRKMQFFVMAHLPCKQQKIQRVEGDVGCARSFIALRHGGHQRGCCGPQHYDGCSSVQVRTREQLTCKQTTTLMCIAAQRPADDTAQEHSHLRGIVESGIDGYGCRSA